MRIISDYKDYYDSAQMYGQDPDLLFLRKSERFEIDRATTPMKQADGSPLPPRVLEVAPLVERLRKLPRSLRYLDRLGDEYEFEEVKIPIAVKLIGFCGVLYPALEIGGHTFYDTDSIPEIMSDTYLKPYGLDVSELADLLIFKFKQKSPRRGSRSGYVEDPEHHLTHENWRRHVAEFSKSRFDEVFIRIGVPIFSLRLDDHDCAFHPRIVCELNPLLKKEDFQKIKPPTEAFQEIAMYLGNQLAKQPDPVAQISDEIMRDEKGFDKWSFRRHKEEDKKFRKKNPPSK